MSWWDYVVKTSGTESPKAMQARTRIDGPNFSRWKAGHVPKVEMVAQFARAYGRPVLEAFVAAEFLTAAEAKARPAMAPDYSQLTNEELLRLVRGRMRDEGSGSGGTPINGGSGGPNTGGSPAVTGPWSPVSDPPHTVPEDKVAMDDPDLLRESEAQEEGP